METKEQLLEMLGHIQHHCHEKDYCYNCIFKYQDGAIEKCVFCGVINIDCFPPEEWNLDVLREKMLGGKQ